VADLEPKLDIMEQICEGLAFAHAMEVVHRDLKPGNIHVQPGGQVKILDFGLARLGASEMTRAGTVLGTPHYMSPEQVRGEKADARSDVFALGAMFYELLAGRKAFDGDSVHTVLFQVLEQEPEPIRNCVDLPSILVELVEKSLRKDPDARFHDASDLLSAVRAVRRALADGRSEAALESELGLPPAEGRAGADSRVVGSVALQPQPGSRRPLSVTLSAKARTQVDPRRARLRPSMTPPSRVPFYVGSGLAFVAILLAAGFAGLFILQRPVPPAATTPDGARPIDDLTRVLLASQVELARNKLDEKSYRAAASRAEQALKLDPQSEDAKQVLAKAQDAIKKVDAAAEETRSALATGDTARAARSLWALLSLDPRYEGTAAFVGPLNPVFRDQAAEARRLMAEARASAERAKAHGIPGFATAASASAEGEALLAKKEYAAAAGRLLEARDEYDRARRAVH
jgi:hypothetical protein